MLSGCPNEVVAFADQMLSEVQWRPDPIFVMDVCEAENGLRLLELNGFSCSSAYLCNLETLVATASELALWAW